MFFVNLYDTGQTIQITCNYTSIFNKTALNLRVYRTGPLRSVTADINSLRRSTPTPKTSTIVALKGLLSYPSPGYASFFGTSYLGRQPRARLKSFRNLKKSKKQNGFFFLFSLGSSNTDHGALRHRQIRFVGRQPLSSLTKPYVTAYIFFRNIRIFRH